MVSLQNRHFEGGAPMLPLSALHSRHHILIIILIIIIVIIVIIIIIIVVVIITRPRLAFTRLGLGGCLEG